MSPSPDPAVPLDPLLNTGGPGGLRALVRQAQAGDRDALARLFELHEPMMLRWARKRLGAPLRTMDETRDVLHDAYTVVLRKIASFQMEDSTSFARWLRGIITRVVLQKSGSQYLRRRTALPDETGAFVSPEMTPMTRVSLNELDALRWHIVRGFDRMDRKIYRLRSRGISALDIANLVGMTDRAVRMRFAKAEARLRVRMQAAVGGGEHGRGP